MTADQASQPDEAGHHRPGLADRYARAALAILTEPGDPVLGALLRSVPPQEILDVVMSDCRDPGLVLGRAAERDGAPGAGEGGRGPVRRAVAGRAVERWRARRSEVPRPGRLELWEQAGFRIVCPGDSEWPTQLDDLGDARPVALWLTGTTNLRFACLHSVSVVGSRAATAYGLHVATELSAELAGLGWTVISGGA